MNAAQSDTLLTTPLTTETKEAVSRPRKKDVKNLMRREGIWYFHKFVNGKREFNGRKTPFSLETADLAVAKAKRDAILKSSNKAQIDRALGQENRDAAKMSEIFAAYRKAPGIRANDNTREHNISGLVRMVRVVRGAEFDVEAMSSAELTWKLVEDWQAKRIAEAKAEKAGDLAALEAAKRSLNSVLTQVQSVFSKAALAAYRSLHLPPNVKEFAEAMPVPARRQEEPEHLTDDFVAGLLAAADEFKKTDAGGWAVFQLMTWGGLRNVECLHSRSTWLTEIPGVGYRMEMKATEDFLPKGRSRAVVIPKDVGDGLLALRPEADPETGRRDEHLVPAKTFTDRHNACYKRVQAWLKAQGVDREVGKIAYRLRKYFLHKVAEQQLPIIAQAAGGHASMQTTQDHYIGKPKMVKPITLA